MLRPKYPSSCLKHPFLNLQCPLKLTLMLERYGKIVHRFERVWMLLYKQSSRYLKHLLLNLQCSIQIALMLER